MPEINPEPDWDAGDFLSAVGIAHYFHEEMKGYGVHCVDLPDGSSIRMSFKTYSDGWIAERYDPDGEYIEASAVESKSFSDVLALLREYGMPLS